MNDNMTLDALAAQLREAKADEARAAEHRKQIERLIVEHPDVASALKDEGTTKVGPVKVTTRLTRKWDAIRLAEIEREVDPAYWPFKAEPREDRRASRLVEERFPDLWQQIEGALTLTPAKPSVQVVD